MMDKKEVDLAHNDLWYIENATRLTTPGWMIKDVLQRFTRLHLLIDKWDGEQQ